MSINRFRKMLIKLAALSEEDTKTLNIILFNESDRRKENEHENNNS